MTAEAVPATSLIRYARGLLDGSRDNAEYLRGIVDLLADTIPAEMGDAFDGDAWREIIKREVLRNPNASIDLATPVPREPELLWPPVPMVTYHYREALMWVPFALHIGLHPSKVRDEVQMLLRLGAEGVAIDGDGWESWGEKPGTDNNDATTLHVVALYRSRGRAESAVAPLASRGALTPMRTPSQAGVRWVITDAWDWDLELSEG